jgi:hypothetical protein
VFFRNGKGQYFRNGAGLNCIDLRGAEGQASCCGVNLAFAALGCVVFLGWLFWVGCFGLAVFGLAVFGWLFLGWLFLGWRFALFVDRWFWAGCLRLAFVAGCFLGGCLRQGV